MRIHLIPNNYLCICILDRARDRRTGQIVALKKIRLEPEPDNTKDNKPAKNPDQLPPEGLPLTHFREIQLLQSLRHPNIVHLHEVAVGRLPGSIFMVMDYCTHDIAALLDSMRVAFTPSEVKCLMYQLLQGVEFMHRNCVIHRDLKLSNLLLDEGGVLKIADFGLARKFGSPPPELQRRNWNPMTPKVVTLWYRSPELLCGSSMYTTDADLWSVGCIFGELLLHSPLLPGTTELSQLTLIFNLIGPPSFDERAILAALVPVRPLDLPKTDKKGNLWSLFSSYSHATVELIDNLLKYDPSKRWSVQKCLESRYFAEAPKRLDPKAMRTFPDTRYKADSVAEMTTTTAALKPPADYSDNETKKYTTTTVSDYIRRKREADNNTSERNRKR